MINVIEIKPRFVVNPLPSRLFLSHNCGPNSTATGTATLPRSCEHDTRIHGSNLPQLQREDKQQKSEQRCPYLWVFKVPWFSNPLASTEISGLQAIGNVQKHVKTSC